MDTTAKGMPKGLISLYWIQMFSTFSYAVLYSSLSLYITKQLGLSSTLSNSVVGLFLAFNYVLHLVGGALGGNWLSNRFVFLFTTLLQTIGIVFFIFPNEAALYWGLSLFLIGCGLNTTSYNTILTQRFSSDDSRRDKAFFYSYSAMNVGFWAGYLFSGLYDSSNQYQPIFYTSIITNLITLFLIMGSWNYLSDVNTALSKLTYKARSIKNSLGIFCTLLLMPGLLVCFHFPSLSNGLVVLITHVTHGQF
ncbi:MFS transporter [Legionella sp. km772]|uniref:MFS transporter n=1 Tax=Legionella sp. km772 TaxID=2498111 RepID=UPI000F8F5758|nr:MFS transporter [Legionella sp. km772]